MPSNRNNVKRDAISKVLNARISDLKKGGYKIKGNLQVAPGHSYWWFLEYGTGQYHDSSNDGELNRPEATEEYEPEGGPYEIAIEDAKILVYMTKIGERKFKKVTTHPGIHPIGFVRTALFEAEINLKGNLTRMIKSRKRKGWDALPTRDELVQLVNKILLSLLRHLQAFTPDDKDIDPYHEGRNPAPLAQAWKISKAR